MTRCHRSETAKACPAWGAPVGQAVPGGGVSALGVARSEPPPSPTPKQSLLHPQSLPHPPVAGCPIRLPMSEVCKRHPISHSCHLNASEIRGSDFRRHPSLTARGLLSPPWPRPAAAAEGSAAPPLCLPCPSHPRPTECPVRGRGPLFPQRKPKSHHVTPQLCHQGASRTRRPRSGENI